MENLLRHFGEDSATTMYQDNDTVHVNVDVPGVEMKDLEVELQDKSVVVTTHRRCFSDMPASTRKRLAVFSLAATCDTKLVRRIGLGKDIQPETLEAKLDHGVLYIEAKVVSQ